MPRAHRKPADRRDFKKTMQSRKKADVPSLFLLVRVPSWEARESRCSCLGHSLPVGSWQVTSMRRVSI